VNEPTVSVARGANGWRKARRKVIEGAAGLAIGLAALYLAFRNVQLADVLHTLREADPWLLAFALLLVMSGTMASAIRWRALLYPHRPNVGGLFSIFLVSRLAGAVLPWKLGTFVRSYLVTLRSEAGLAFSVGSVALERFLDLGIILLIFLVVLPSAVLPGWLRDSGLGMVVFFLPAFGLLLLVIRVRLSLLEWLEGWLGKGSAKRLVGLVRAAGRATESLANLTRGQLAGQIVLPSVWIWSAGTLTNYVVMLALGIRLPFLVAVVLLLALQLGTKLPGAPADVGVFHYVAVLVLVGYGVDKAVALSYGLALHALVYLVPALLGAVVLSVTPRALGSGTLGQVARDHVAAIGRLFDGGNDE